MMNSTPSLNLAALRDKLDRAEEVVVTSDGVVRSPEDPAVKDSTQKKTTLKPSRWYGR